MRAVAHPAIAASLAQYGVPGHSPSHLAGNRPYFDNKQNTCLIVYPLQLVLTVMPRVLLDSVRLHGYPNGIHGYTHGLMDGPMESMGTPMEPMGVSMDSMCIPMVHMCIPMNSMGAPMESVGIPMDTMVSIALDDSCLTMI